MTPRDAPSCLALVARSASAIVSSDAESTSGTIVGSYASAQARGEDAARSARADPTRVGRDDDAHHASSGFSRRRNLLASSVSNASLA
jgi:hypothetical protein